VLVIASTNEQVRQLAERLADVGVRVVHLCAAGEELAPSARLVSTGDVNVAAGASCVVATTYQAAKHARTIGHFDFGVVDEAYQVRSDRTGLWALTLADRWAFVGDPGQIQVFTALGRSPFLGDDDPVTSIVDSARAQGADIGLLDFDWTWRLPAHGASTLNYFYDAPARGVALPEDRSVSLDPARARKGIGRAADRVLDKMTTTGWGFLELPGDAIDPADLTTASAIAATVKSVLERNMEVECERDGCRRITPLDIGVAVSTDAQLGLAQHALKAAGIRGAEVRTYNRHQGLEYALSILWHPLSGIAEVDGFYVDVGRLCVGVSRHRHGAIVVGRSGLRRLLADPPISPEAPWPGQRDRLLQGWLAHAALLDHLDAIHATIAA
jgi:hypothetical protein